MQRIVQYRDPGNLGQGEIDASGVVCNWIAGALTWLGGVLLVAGGIGLLSACSDDIGAATGTTPQTRAALRVRCAAASVTADQTSRCFASAANGADVSATVTWSASAGHIDASGQFTAPPVSTSTAVTITATAHRDRSRAGATVVHVDPPASAYNVLPITLDQGPPGAPHSQDNGLFASVQVCMPGSTSQCQTIDHVLIDPGSVGLRLLSSASGGAFSLPLPPQLAADGNPLVECFPVAGGFVWGPVAVADLYLSGEAAISTPIQIIAPLEAPAIPGSCHATGRNVGTLAALGAHGILGVGLFLQDCGEACHRQAYNLYYACSGTGCVATMVSTTQQIQHPVALFANDNNGVIVEWPALPSAEQPITRGALIFGIGTQANNTLRDTPEGLCGRAVDDRVPLFFGHTLQVAIEHQNTPAGVGPYWVMY